MSCTSFQPHYPKPRVSSQAQVEIKTLCSFISSPDMKLSFLQDFQYCVLLCDECA